MKRWFIASVYVYIFTICCADKHAHDKIKLSATLYYSHRNQYYSKNSCERSPGESSCRTRAAPSCANSSFESSLRLLVPIPDRILVP